MKYVRSLLLACLLSCAAGIASAQEYSAGSIKVSGLWTREVPQGSKVAGGFMTITNTGTQPDMLVGGTVELARGFEVHETAMVGDVMTMRAVSPGLVVAPGQSVVLRPGSYHAMLTDLKERPKVGKPVKGTLVFQKAGTVAVEYKVEPLGARAPGQSMHGGQTKH